jgi:hypothetical protein
MGDYYEYEIIMFEGDSEYSYYGVTYADSFQKALSNVLGSYSNSSSDVISVKLIPWGIEDCCVSLTQEALKDLRESLL